MSAGRSFFLVSVGIALGALVANGDIDFSRQIDAFRSADRGSKASAEGTLAPFPSGVAPPPAVEPAPETVVVTLPSAKAPEGPRRTRPATGDLLSLAQQLQGELHRVGCYAGAIDGVWSPPSQRAMKAFTDRVNAHLPVDEPDYVLLALVRAQRDKVCAIQCPPSQGLTADNRCVPDAILSRAAKPVPERTPTALNRPTLPVNPSPLAEIHTAPAGPAGGDNPAATIAQTPGQTALAPGATPQLPQQKPRIAARKPSPGPFGAGIFKLLISGY